VSFDRFLKHSERRGAGVIKTDRAGDLRRQLRNPRLPIEVRTEINGSSVGNRSVKDLQPTL